MKIVGMLVLLVGLAGFAMAEFETVPEIDAGSATTALALVSGAVLVVRSRRKQ